MKANKANFITLGDMQQGQRAVVQALHLEGSMARRLTDLGLIEGTDVICCRKAPGGSPIAYSFRGAVIALRTCDAHAVDVLP